MRGGMTRHLRLDVGRASWGCSDRRGGSCFAHLPRECETAFMSVVGSDDRPGGWSYACIAGLFRMSRCRSDIVKTSLGRFHHKLTPCPVLGQIGQSRAEMVAILLSEASARRI